MAGMSHTITITAIERAPFASTRVDREAGHIDGVLICGVQSRNGRDYPTSVLSRDYARYEGAAVNCDHADESTVGRRLGWFSDVKPGADGRPRGRLNLLKSHPMSAAVFEAAERNPSLFGMSHVAVCGTKRINGRETVESINKVLSIDLVADPATTKSLYESYHPTGQPMKLTTYCEQVAAKWPAVAERLKIVREMDGMGDVSMDSPPDMAAGPDDPVKAAFSQAMHALVDQFDGGSLEGPALLSKLKTLMKAAEKMNGKEAEPEAEEPAEVSEPPEMESLRKQLDTVLKENAELKLNTLIGDTPLSPVQRKAVGLLTEEADRKALIESLKAAGKTSGPKSGEQNTQRKLTESASVPTDGAKFAEFIR